jgi:hypothetical protein
MKQFWLASASAGFLWSADDDVHLDPVRAGMVNEG